MHFRTSQTAYSHNAIGALVPPRSGCQYNAARQDTDALQHLADDVVARHYPEATASDRRYRALLSAVIARQAGLVARWLGVGFIHGVMDTGHMSITGETIDYGPCAFMDAFHPGRVYSSIDHHGRYAYGNQPRIAQWSLSRLAQSLLPLLDDEPDKAVEEAQGAIDGFPERFEHAYLARFRAKLCVVEAHEGDAELIDTLLQAMSETGADVTNTFRALCDAAEGADGPFRAQLGEDADPGRLARALARTPGRRIGLLERTVSRHAPRKSGGHA